MCLSGVLSPRGEKAVARRYVPMNEVIVLEVLAPFADVHSAHQQVLHHQGRWPVLRH